MKKILFLTFLAIFVGFTGTALAKEISGEVVGKNPDAKSLTVSHVDPQTAMVEEIEVVTQPATTYKGAQSFDEIAEMDEVVVVADEDPASGTFKATSIEKKAESAESDSDKSLPVVTGTGVIPPNEDSNTSESEEVEM